jgi:hypothetical protein
MTILDHLQGLTGLVLVLTLIRAMPTMFGPSWRPSTIITRGPLP